MSDPTPEAIAKALNYHSDNLTHILNCDQCWHVHCWRAGIALGVLAVVGIAYLVASWMESRKWRSIDERRSK